MAEATTSRHESNYIKIAMVVLRVSPRAVRVEFDKKFDPKYLQTTLNSKQGLLSDLKKKKRITDPQWNVLFPTAGRLLYLFALKAYRLSELKFFVYIKSCQYSMFYTTCLKICYNVVINEKNLNICLWNYGITINTPNYKSASYFRSLPNTDNCYK